MKPLDEHACPLCKKKAKFRLADHDNRKHYLCDHCTEFQISTGAEKRLSESIPEWRSQYSEMAKRAKDDCVLVITLPFAPKIEGIANPALVGAYVLRKDLPN